MMERDRDEYLGPLLSKETPVSKEQEVPRHVRVGIVGPLASGKTTLANLLGESWGIEPIEENYGENPFLRKFYRAPRKFSLRSQSWFLIHKARQLESLSSDFPEIIDPAQEMNFLYAMVQYQMGWMTDAEWRTYQVLYDVLQTGSQIRDPDIFIVVNARGEVLKKRILQRGRKFELRMLGRKRKPDYFDRLSSAVATWSWQMREKVPIIEVDSEQFDYAKREQDRQQVIKHVEDWTGYYLFHRMNGKGKDGREIIFPDFLRPRHNTADVPPSLPAESRRFYNS